MADQATHTGAGYCTYRNRLHIRRRIKVRVTNFWVLLD
jgi:hypothetical protein